MRWEYHAENICTDNPVATLYNDNNKPVLQVKENRYAYYTEPANEHIKSSSISYHDARKMNTKEEETGEPNTVLFNAVKHACICFEEDYHQQITAIKKSLDL